MELIAPSAEYKDSFMAALEEYRTETNSATQWYCDLKVEELRSDFGAFVEKERSHAEGKNLPAGFIPQVEYWLVDGGEYIGGLNIRTRFTDHLLRFGGQIGYNVRPSERGKGYGTTMLALALPEAKKLGFEKVLITCDATNEGSRKVIERNGGVFENRVPNPDTGVDKLRYWVQLA